MVLEMLRVLEIWRRGRPWWLTRIRECVHGVGMSCVRWPKGLDTHAYCTDTRSPGLAGPLYAPTPESSGLCLFCCSWLSSREKQGRHPGNRPFRVDWMPRMQEGTAREILQRVLKVYNLHLNFSGIMIPDSELIRCTWNSASRVERGAGSNARTVKHCLITWLLAWCHDGPS